MTPACDDFIRDIARIEKLLEFLDRCRHMPPCAAGAPTSDAEVSWSRELQTASAGCKADFVILAGTLILYLAGRFEYFVRMTFEDLCSGIAQQCKAFRDLPREMRKSLIVYTAEVMLNPARFGHGEEGVKSFVRNLSQNVTDSERLSEINSQCLSITTENMRSATVEALFQRIGAKELWKRVGEQAKIQVFFMSSDAKKAEADAKRKIDELMDTRNRIAHPVSDVTWPDDETVLSYAKFLRVLAEALTDVSSVFQSSLTLERLRSMQSPKDKSTECQGSSDDPANLNQEGVGNTTDSRVTGSCEEKLAETTHCSSPETLELASTDANPTVNS